MVCDTDVQLKYSVSKIKETYEEYKSLVHLQTQFIEKHSEIGENVFEVMYSDGTIIKVDYNNTVIKRKVSISTLFKFCILKRLVELTA